MNQNDFLSQQQAAVERMREMNARSEYYTKKNIPIKQSPPKNNTVPPKTNKSLNSLESLNIPFLDSLLGDGDSALILGLLLILMSEKSDKLLLFALIYILL